MRRFKDSLAHIDLGRVGNGLSDGLNSRCETMKTSFSASSGLSIGAERAVLLSIGTTSIPSSICLIKHFPECSLELLLSLLTGKAVYMLGSGWMLLTDRRGRCMNAIRGREYY